MFRIHVTENLNHKEKSETMRGVLLEFFGVKVMT